MTDREAFEAAIRENPDDAHLRFIFADWLEEQGDDSEADRQRRYLASKEWMTNWVRSINYGKWEFDEHGDYLKDENGNRIPAKKDNLGDPHTLEDAIEAGHCAVKGKIYCWGSDAGQDYFFTRDYSDGDAHKVCEWFSHWSVLTGIAVPGLDAIVKRPPFRCAC